jgi:hypothetical protein
VFVAQVIDTEPIISVINKIAAIPYMGKMTYFFVILSAAKESECAKMLRKSYF